MLILRTLLFVPGNQARKIEKARSVPSDALILDLEDSVPPSEKNSARKMVAASLNGLALSGQEVFARINPLQTPYGPADIEAVVTGGLRGIFLPKTESAEDIHKADALIAGAEKKAGLEAGSTGLIALIETPKGIINVYQIASASARILGLTIGAEDYTMEMGINRTKEGAEIYYLRTAVAVACHAANVLAIDCVYGDVKDIEGFSRETRSARQMGFQGKLAIHPDQVIPANQIFAPAEEEISQARRVVAAYEAALAQGQAVTALDGKMVDVPVAERARKLLSLAESIAEKESASPA